MNLQQRPTDVGAKRVVRSDQEGAALVPGLAPSPHREAANAVVAALASDACARSARR